MSLKEFEEHSWIDNLVKTQPEQTPEKYLEFSRMVVEQVKDDIRFTAYYNSQDTELYFVDREVFDDELFDRIEKLRRRVLEGVSLTGTGFETEYGEPQIYMAVHEEVVVLDFHDRENDEGVLATIDYPGGFLDFL